MPYANYADKLAANRRYSRTPKGREAKRRSSHGYYWRHREVEPINHNPAPLAQALNTWRN